MMFQPSITHFVLVNLANESVLVHIPLSTDSLTVGIYYMQFESGAIFNLSVKSCHSLGGGTASIRKWTIVANPTRIGRVKHLRAACRHAFCLSWDISGGRLVNHRPGNRESATLRDIRTQLCCTSLSVLRANSELPFL
jgi:hypothetical protein